MNNLAYAFGDRSGYEVGLYLIGQKALEQAPPRTRYEILKSLYESNGVYAEVSKYLEDQKIWAPDRKPLGNPTNEIVEFYAENLLVGELELETENQRILPPIDLFWRWSQFDAQKVVLSREIAMLGDSFIKISQKARRVFAEYLDPATVIDFDVDERGFITWIRCDVPRQDRDAAGKLTQMTKVEVWSKAEQLYRLWEYTEDKPLLGLLQEDLEMLGVPTVEKRFSEFKIDFIPIVHIPFRRMPGELRGQAAVWPSIHKIVELDLMITALHQNYYAYDRPTWAIESEGLDSTGRPVPAPILSGTTDGDAGPELQLGKERLFRLPRGWKLSSTVPNINFEAGLRQVQEGRRDLERERSELLYGRLSDIGGTVSGRALQFMLVRAIKAATEARANVEQGLVRVNQMALTIMQGAGLVGSEIGLFDNEDPSKNFDHQFRERPILPDDALDDAQVELARAQAFKAWKDAGLPLLECLARAGYTNEDADKIAAAMVAQAEREAPIPESDQVPEVQQ